MRTLYRLGALAVLAALTGSPALAQDFYTTPGYDDGPGYGYDWGYQASYYDQGYYPAYDEGAYPAYDNGYYYGAYGPVGAAAGVVGGAVETAGAIATAPFRAFDGRESYAMARADTYCAERYRSYDPASGTFMGYDGRRHPCR